MKKYLSILALILALSSCSGNIKGSWSCPVLEGGKGNCSSISDADDLMSLSKSENSNIHSYLDQNQKIEITLVAPKLKDLEKLHKKDDVDKTIIIKESGSGLLRTKEKVGKVWFAPYIDSEANQHGESVVYIVDEQAKWISQR